MRASHRPALIITLVVIATGLGIAIVIAPFTKLHQPKPLQSPEEAQELVVLVHPGPIVYFPGPDGTLTGFDVDLARQFAAEKKVALRFAIAKSTADVIAAIARGEAHIGAGGLIRPPPVASAGKSRSPPLSPPVADPPADAAPEVLWTMGFATVEPVLIYNRDGFRPANWRDLDGETVAFLEDAGFASEIATIRSAHPGVRWQPLSLPSAAALISQVSDGTLGYAIVGSLAASLARNVYLDFDVAFPAGRKREVAWVVPPGFPDLRQELDRFLARLKRDGTLERLAERYLPSARQIPRVDAEVLHERIRTLLPQYRNLFLEAQEKTGIEWRLLAAIAYQESQWDPGATSETGVRGFMQITEDTAKHLGVSDLLDPAQNVVGGCALPARPQEQAAARASRSRTGPGSRSPRSTSASATSRTRASSRRTQKLNPDLWSDVKKVLPLLAVPEYYAAREAGLCARRHAGRVRRPRARATTTSCSRTSRRTSRGCACASTCRTREADADSRSRPEERSWNGLASPEAWIALLTPDRARDRPRRRQHHLHLDPRRAPAARAAQPRRALIGLGLAMVMRIALLLSLAWMMRLTDPLFSVHAPGALRTRPDPDRRRPLPARQVGDGDPQLARGRGGRGGHAVPRRAELLRDAGPDRHHRHRVLARFRDHRGRHGRATSRS